MSSTNKPIDRYTDIACRKSTANGLDDQIGQEIGEVNQILERYFQAPVAPPPRLDFEAARMLILTQPAPAPPAPWYQQMLMPGHLAVGTLCLLLLYVGITMVPVASRAVPAVEARLYAQGSDGLKPLPPPSTVAPSDSILRKPFVHVEEHQSDVSVPGVVTHRPISYATVTIPQEQGGRLEVESGLRELRQQLQQTDPSLKLVSSFREVEIRQRLTIVDIMLERFAGAEGTAFPAGIRVHRQPIGAYQQQMAEMQWENGIMPTSGGEQHPSR
ncbi:MAG TPA: hypothetical protein VEI97_05745 [bacterium]|nr:hypothetical protein [bacterium]